jgi:hypothetical protein
MLALDSEGKIVPSEFANAATTTFYASCTG